MSVCDEITPVTPKPPCETRFRVHSNVKTGGCVPPRIGNGDVSWVEKEGILFLFTKYKDQYRPVGVGQKDGKIYTIDSDCMVTEVSTVPVWDWQEIVKDDTSPAKNKSVEMYSYTPPIDGVYHISGWNGLYISHDDYTESGAAETHGDSSVYLHIGGADIKIGGSEDGNNQNRGDDIYNNGGMNWIGELKAGETITISVTEELSRAIPKKLTNILNVSIHKIG